jgi:hypothetical protein
MWMLELLTISILLIQRLGHDATWAGLQSSFAFTIHHARALRGGILGVSFYCSYI